MLRPLPIGQMNLKVLLATEENLLVLDDRMGLFSSPVITLFHQL